MGQIIYVAPDDLRIGDNRQRRTFDEDKLIKLKEGILGKGLMHPIVVRETPDFVELVAGERRQRAIDMIYSEGKTFLCNGEAVPSGTYPCLRVGDLSPLELEEAELEENVLRDDLSWQDQAAAVSRLHKLRTAQAESRGEKQTLRKTMAELAGDLSAAPSTAPVSQALILADHLDNPDVTRAKDAKEAMRIIEKQQARAHREQLAKDFDLQAAGSTSQHELQNMPMEDYIKTLPPKHLDVIVTDPPYAVDASGFGSQVRTDHDYEDRPEKVWPMLETFAKESYRVAKDQAHIYCFCDIRGFLRLRLLFGMAGWDVFSTPLIWFKSNGQGIIPRPKHGPRRTYEVILFAIKGKKEVNYVGLDVLSVPADTKRDHGAQKPVALYYELLNRSAKPGDKVGDFFVGSGTIYPAAQKARCTAYGCEKVGANYMLAVERINKLESGEELADEVAYEVVYEVDRLAMDSVPLAELLGGKDA